MFNVKYLQNHLLYTQKIYKRQVFLFLTTTIFDIFNFTESQRKTELSIQKLKSEAYDF